VTRPPTDGERQHYAGALQEAVAAGRIDLADFDRRVAAVFRAGTLDEIEQIVAGLPVVPPTHVLRGSDGTATLERDRVVLRFPAGIATQDIKEARSPRVIALTAIAAVEHEPERHGGYLRLRLAGEAPSYQPRPPAFDANAVVFAGSAHTGVEAFAAELRQRIAIEARTPDPQLLPAQGRLPGLPPPPPGELFVQLVTGEGTVTADENGVQIRFQSALAFGARRKSDVQRWLPLTAIAEVEVLPARLMRWGYLRFVLAGLPAGYRRPKPAHDVDSVALITAKEEGTAEDLAAHVAARITGPRVVEPALLPGNDPAHWPAPPPVAAPPAGASPGVADAPAQLRELARLRAEGIITDADFEAKKRDLLDRW
jgi:hypothetical protein